VTFGTKGWYIYIYIFCLNELPIYVKDQLVHVLLVDPHIFVEVSNLGFKEVFTLNLLL
jgi:hypothetical protein